MTARGDGPGTFAAIRAAIVQDQANAAMTERGWEPVFTASASAKIAVIGQAPGLKAQVSGVAWNDASGDRLIDWLGVAEEQFRDPAIFAVLPMDFYFPGKGPSGDLPPRKGFAQRWHPPLLALMPNIRLTLLIGGYAQKHYLPSQRRRTLTDRVRHYSEFLPEYFPLVHPSPLNFRWHAKNPWFVTDVVPASRTSVNDALG